VTNPVKINLKKSVLEVCSVTISSSITTTIIIVMRMETQLVSEALFFINIHTADYLRAFHWIFHDCFTSVLQLAVVATLVELI